MHSTLPLQFWRQPAQVGSTNACLKVQGLVSFPDLWAALHSRLLMPYFTIDVHRQNNNVLQDGLFDGRISQRKMILGNRSGKIGFWKPRRRVHYSHHVQARYVRSCGSNDRKYD